MQNAYRWQCYELELTAFQDYENPYLDQSVLAIFIGPDGSEWKRKAFWDGGSRWIVRFAPPLTGAWKYEISPRKSADSGLSEQGQFICLPYSGDLPIYQHGFLSISENKRYLCHADGTPFFWLADTHWLGLGIREKWDESNFEGIPSMFRGMADIRARQGYSVYQLNFFLSERGDCCPGGTENEGGCVWEENSKWKMPNPAFFRNADQRIKYLTEKGLVVSLGLDWGQTINSENAEGFKQSAEYIVARYGAFPVVWNVCGEYSVAEDNAPFWAETAEKIYHEDCYNNPKTLHSGIEMGKFKYHSDYYADKPWYQFSMIQTGHYGNLRHEDLGRWRDKYCKSEHLPLLESECSYEGIKYTPEGFTRTAAYMSIMSGSFGFSYGAEGIWNATWDENDEFQLWGKAPIPWYKAIFFPCGAQMEYLRRFFEALSWWRLEPANYLCAWEQDASSPYAPLIKNDSEGDCTLIYYPFDARYSRDFAYTGFLCGRKPGYLYEIKWFNPGNGKYTAPFKLEADSKGLLHLPAAPTVKDDWMAVVTSE